VTGSSTSQDRQQTPANIRPAAGKLGILTPGLGAVATTFMAGVESVRRGLTAPSARSRRWRPSASASAPSTRAPLIKDFVPLADLNDIVFGAWDPIPDDAYTAARRRRARGARPRAGQGLPERDQADAGRVRDRGTSRGLNGTNVKTGTKREQAEQLREDIRASSRRTAATAWCSCGAARPRSTSSPARSTRRSSLRGGVDASDESIAPSMLYAYAAIMEGCAFANGAPNLTADIPALLELANDSGVAVSARTSRPARPG
jgi:myo-inositol-1-phosphate synthase